MSKLIPPDPERCQAESRAPWSFMTLGPKPPMERCKNKPTVIVHERAPGPDGLTGSMSMCSDCFVQFCMQECPTPDKYRFEELK